MIQRGLLIALALAACFWLGSGLRSTRLQAEAEERTPIASEADIDRRRDLFDRSRFLNPDRRPDIREAQLLLVVSRPAEATRVLEDVVRDEPENIEAWAGLAQAALDNDPRRAAEARRRVRELSPPVRASD